jgi:hypothetical protein
MNTSEIEKYGTPDIQIVGLQIWVHGYQFEEAENNDDSGWLRLSAHCGAKGADVWVSGSYLQVHDIDKFASDSEKLYQREIKEIELNPLEPELRIAIKAIDSLGHFELTIEITPDHLSQNHKFQFEIDQSYLPVLVTQCRGLLKHFPCRISKNK